MIIYKSKESDHTYAVLIDQATVYDGHILWVSYKVCSVTSCTCNVYTTTMSVFMGKFEITDNTNEPLMKMLLL